MAGCGAERVKDGPFCFPGIATGWGELLGSVGLALAAAYICEVVLPPALVADCAISRAVMLLYSGRGTLAMAPLVAIGAQLIIVAILVLFGLIMFSASVLATCSICTLALEQAAGGSFTSFFCLNKLKDFFEVHVLIPVSEQI